MARSPKKQPVAVISGTTRGIGLDIAKALAKEGYRLLLLNRTIRRQAVEWNRLLGTDAFEVIPVDFRSFESIRQAASEVQAQAPSLDLLINNAGGIYPNNTGKTPSNSLNTNLVVNHLSPFLLTLLLLDNLLATSQGRIITLVSAVHFGAGWATGDFDFAAPLKPLEAYANAHLASVASICKLGSLLTGQSVTVNGFCPGRVATDLRRTWLVRRPFRWFGQWSPLYWKIASRSMATPKVAAETVALMATDRSFDKCNGRYMNQRREWCAPSGAALSVVLQDQIWLESKRLTGLSDYSDSLGSTKLNA